MHPVFVRDRAPLMLRMPHHLHFRHLCRGACHACEPTLGGKTPRAWSSVISTHVSRS
jgi:hypothetical protein